MYIIKASGQRQKFRPEKIKGTLMRAGAPDEISNEIVREVQNKIRDGTTTKEILSFALKSLRKKRPEIASIYNLKNAIMQLGPTGFPFEKYLSKILIEHGYKVEVGKMIKGNLAVHEIDISASKEKKYMVECKYHNDLGTYTGMKTALYVYARFLDLKKIFDQPWLATNTKFSNQVIKYSEGVNMKLTGWGYPANENLQILVESKKMYPITILNTLNKTFRGKLLKENFVTLKDLLDIPFKELKNKTKIPEETLKIVVEEARKISEISLK